MFKEEHLKEAKRKYLAEIILLNCNKPCVLFKTIDSVLNVPLTVCFDASYDECETFLRFFIDKVTTITAQISPSVYDPSIPVLCSAVFDKFEPVTICFYRKLLDI